MKRLFLLLLTCLSLMALPATAATTLRIAAASDLRPVLPELIALFVRSHPGLDISPSYAASGTLCTQIEQGAPFDLFLSADELYAERIADAGLAGAAPQRYTRGSLVLWTAAALPMIADLRQLPQRFRGRLALANPRHAPYGQRAMQALQSAGVWEPLQAQIVYGDSVSQAAQLIVTGAAEAGLFSASLLNVLPKSGNGLIIEAGEYQPLWQAGLVLRSAANAEQAEAFLRFLRSPPAQQVFADHRYLPLDAGG